MRRGIVLFGLLLVPSALGAQNTGLEPREQVAALIRQALRAPEQQESWTGLASGLAALQPGDDEGVRGLRAAMQIADSLSREPAQVNGVEDPLEARDALGLKAGAGTLAGLLDLGSDAARQAGRSLQRNGLVLPLLLSLPLIGLLLLRRRMMGLLPSSLARQRRRSRVPRRSRETGSGVAGPGATKDFALALSKSGLPPSEVARQTGLAQDAVAFLLALHGRGGVAVPGTRMREGR